MRMIQKPNVFEQPESSSRNTKDNNGNKPYCNRCFTKGHAMEDCVRELYCEICDCNQHPKPRCPIFRAARQNASICGFAVDGLGFFHVPHTSTQKSKSDSRAAVIRVMDGSLSIAQVKSELERLIPARWTWNVEKAGANTFKTLFPSKLELKRMTEWGTVHTRINNVKLKIEEKGGNGAKARLPKVWIQCSGHPEELREFLIIWVVGSLMGVTMDVDMIFTRKYEICRFQAPVLDPNLISHSVNVVIGEYLYELKFRVEEENTGGIPAPMDMDLDDNLDDENDDILGDKGLGDGGDSGTRHL